MSKKFLFLICTLFVGGMQAMAQDFENATTAVKNMGLGWNLGNTLDANGQSISDITNDGYWGQQGLDSETYWGQPYTKPELLKMMKDAGFGAIRVPVTWYNHMDKDGNVNAEWMKRVKEVVNYVIDQGLYCILNVHHDTGCDSGDKDGKVTHAHWIHASGTNYNNNKARFEGLWKQIAEEFKNYDQKLLFEGYNEMLDTVYAAQYENKVLKGFTWGSWCFASFNSPDRYNEAKATDAYKAINDYAQSFVNVVRSTGGNNSTRNLIVNTYAACCGSGDWNNHLIDPITEMKLPTDATSDHLIFQVHDYPTIANTSMDNIKKDIDDTIEKLKTNLVSKGAPVIIGEWGTSNVDNGSDYIDRREVMFEFADYFVKKCKENEIGTFYWMGLTDGMARFFPAFSQPDLAKTILQAYHGTDFNPVLPDASRYSISCTVDFSKQWAELYLYNSSSFTSSEYSSITLELENAPASNDLFQMKMYCSKYKDGTYKNVTEAKTTWTFAATMGTITGITLQCKQNSGQARIKSITLKKKSGEEVSVNPSNFHDCELSNITVITGINEIKQDITTDNRIYNLQGQRIDNPSKGIYIKGGKKYIAK